MDAAVQPAKAPQPSESAVSAPNAVEDFSWLPCRLTVEIPVVRFTVGDLLNLKTGSIAETVCLHTSDVPLRANGLLIGWAEFEVIGDRLAARITEFA